MKVKLPYQYRQTSEVQLKKKEKKQLALLNDPLVINKTYKNPAAIHQDVGRNKIDRVNHILFEKKSCITFKKGLHSTLIENATLINYTLLYSADQQKQSQ